MSLNHQLSETNGQNSALKEQKKVGFQKSTNRKQFKLSKAKTCYTFMYHIIIKKKITYQFKLVTQGTKFKNINPLLKSSLSELVIRGDRHTIAAKQ